jgi:WD40 repeat protein
MGQPLDGVIVSRDGSRAIVISDTGNLVFDLQTGQQIATFQDRAQRINLGPNGRYVAFFVEGNGAGERDAGALPAAIRIWDTSTGEKTLDLSKFEDFFQGVAISPRGDTIATANFSRGFKLWNFVGVPTTVVNAGIMSFALDVWFSPNGSSLVVSDHGGNLYTSELSTGALQTILEGPGPITYAQGEGASPIKAGAFSNDGQMFAVFTYEGIKILNPYTGQLLTRLPVPTDPWVTQIAFSPDQTTLIVVQDGIEVWGVFSP